VKLTLYCPPEPLALLKGHRKIQGAERRKAASLWRDHDLVFATRRGRPIERTEDWRQWKIILRHAAAGWPPPRGARTHCNGNRNWGRSAP